MGLGYWTSERLVYEPSSGELLTNRTWDYWVPQARDIPQDFRIYFRKKTFENELIFGAKGKHHLKKDYLLYSNNSQAASPACSTK